MSRAPLALVLVAFITPALAQPEVFTNRPAFAPAEQPAQRFARCEELRPMAEGVSDQESRVDLWLEGELTLVRSDGALWYMVMCRDLRVMCVTYEQNEMKIGDKVYFKGGYRRLDPNHAVLDPCLATLEPE
jgi:hypothetical protein